MRSRLDTAVIAAGWLRERMDASTGRYPVRLELRLSDTDFVPKLVEFLQEVAKRAGGGHSFSLSADEDDPFKCGIDGDGADKIGYIFLNGKDVTRRTASD